MALIVLPVAVMVGITYGGLLFMMPVVGCILATEGLLVGYRLYLGSRATITEEAPAPAAL